MNLDRVPVLVLLVLAAWVPGKVVHAQSLDEIGFEVTVATPAGFRAQADRVRASMAPGARHGDATANERARVEELLATIEALFESRGSADALDEADRLAVLNAQGEINAILARNDEQRLVCEFVTRTGSHRRSKQCLTVRERRLQREEHQAALRDLERGSSLRGNPP